MQTVLALDDAFTSLQGYQKILRQLDGIEVVPYTTSRAALMYAENNTVDLVITEYDLEPETGLDFVAKFRKAPDRKAVPIIMISGKNENEIRGSKIFEDEVDDFLRKPADPVQFLARVRSLLKLRNRDLELKERAEALAETVRDKTNEILLAEEETIFRLTRAAEYRDKETKNHIVRMGHYARLLAARIGRSTADQELIFLAAPMHDIGKVAIPDSILLKEGKLTPTEWEVMKSHARAGYEILKESDSPVIKMGAEIALAHHEKWDGSGYPQGIKGKDIPLTGRICALTDVFDALVSTRPYKKAWPLNEVLETLKKGKAQHFDPALVDEFLQIIPDVQKVRKALPDTEAA
ncbi:MAG TPA: HD domain-containing phosphohydrolase [Candidatus Acidoferrales bacterium]|nr:HD domain-containing phosphohydrolase [Candidatus Acidoferrales bacterium]